MKLTSTNKYNSENIKSIELLDKYFLINWHVTGWCNYHCPYCINKALEGRYIPEEKVLELAEHMNKFILEQVPSDKKIQLRLIGGEPAFYDWIKILDKFERLDRITMITNFSKDNQFFKDLYEYCYSRKIFCYLICSWHEENLNFRDKFIELNNWIKEPYQRNRKFQYPQLMLLADKDFNEETLNQYTKYGINKIRVSIMRDVNQNHIKLTQEQLDLIENWNNGYEERTNKIYIEKGWVGKKGFKVTFNDGTEEFFVNQSHLTNLMDDGFNPNNFRCTSGKDTLTCLPDGKVTLNKCDFLKDKVIGNFLQDNVKYSATDVICNLNSDGSGIKKCPLCFATSVFRNLKGN